MPDGTAEETWELRAAALSGTLKQNVVPVPRPRLCATQGRDAPARRGEILGSGRKGREAVRVGLQVFEQDGGQTFGAVRDVCPGGRLELLAAYAHDAETPGL